MGSARSAVRIASILRLDKPGCRPSRLRDFRRWWHEQHTRRGFRAAAGELLALGYEFFRNSLPDRRRQRFGDADYDWEFRVNTTSANVSWRSRLAGLFNSAYQPVEPELFHEMMRSLRVDFSQFTFIDIGSGKGRALLLAAEYPFRKITGVELLPELNAIAEENIRKFRSEHPSSPLINTICDDATRFTFPDAPLIVLLNNPLPEPGLRKLAHNLARRARQYDRPLLVVYANPVLEEVFSAPVFRKLSGTRQYSIFAKQD